MIITGNEDMRIRKTIHSIKGSLITLLDEKKDEKITVTELVDRAEVNKKTFYYYYSSMEELMDEMKIEETNNFVEHVNTTPDKSTNAVLDIFFKYFSNKGQFLFSVLCDESGDLLEPIRNVLCTSVKISSSPANPLITQERINRIISNMVLHSFMQWINGEKRQDPKQLTALLSAMIEGAVSKLK